jgi:ATP:ADP antiporter, AAA family
MIPRLVDVQANERRPAAFAFGYLFCVMWSYYGLRPVREAMGIVGNVQALSGLFLGTLAATLALVPVLAWLVSRWPRRRFVPIVYRFFALNLVVFFLLARGSTIAPFVARSFFVWTSVFNMFALAVFWGFMADVFTRPQGTRLFGIIGAGGTLGAMAGSFATSVLAGRIGVAPLLLVSAVLLEIAVQLATRLSPRSDAGAGQSIPEGGTLRWVLGLAGKPLLLAIIGYMLLFTVTSTSLYFAQARIVKAAIATTAARTVLFARIDLAVNLFSVVLQTLVVGPMIRRLGVGAVLVVLPVLTAVGFVALGIAPTLAVLVVFQVARRAVDYGIAKPAREVLFTGVAREDKYKAKSFIDTFVYRAGDALGALAEAGLAKVVVVLPICFAWAAIAYRLGRPRPLEAERHPLAPAAAPCYRAPE